MQLAKEDPVVIIKEPLSVLRERRILCLEKRLTRLSDVRVSWEYTPLHYPECLPGLGKISRAFMRQRLRQELRNLLPTGTRRVICYDSPTQHHFVKKLEERISIYLAIDDRTLTVMGEPIAGELKAEKCLLAKVDYVICVSERLSETIRSRMPKGSSVPINVLGNGYDEELFDPEKKWDKPKILMGIPRPRILVSGHMSERIDWEGIMGAIKIRPEWNWVFIGGFDREIPEKIRSFKTEMDGENHPSCKSRLILRDRVPVEEIPALIANCDACAVPYRLNAFTLASCPLKAIEYLAMGAPVLSTRIPSLLRFGNAIEWVQEGDGQSYARALDLFLRSGKDASAARFRRTAVKEETWRLKAKVFRKMVIDIIDKHYPGQRKEIRGSSGTGHEK